MKEFALDVVLLSLEIEMVRIGNYFSFVSNSVSTAAVLLSAYYVFLWNPATPDGTESPTTLAMASVSHTQKPHYGSHSYSSFALPASQYVDVRSSGHHKSKFSRRASSSKHHNTMPTPQGLVMHQTSSNEGTSTAHQISKRSTGTPVWQEPSTAFAPTFTTTTTTTTTTSSPTNVLSNKNNSTNGPTKHPLSIILGLLSPTNKSSRTLATTNPPPN